MKSSLESRVREHPAWFRKGHRFLLERKSIKSVSRKNPNKKAAFFKTVFYCIKVFKLNN